jgi:putative Ca2+/H+ antiporter (TMEM165/GDT1 family)
MSTLKRIFILTILPLLLPALILAQSGNENGGGAGDIQEEEKHQAVTHAMIHNKEDANSPVESIFHKMDTNHDASLSLDEFVSNYSILDKAKGLNRFSFNSGEGSASNGFWNGFSSSTMMIIATEIGDKTFFIAAVLSMRNSRFVVFTGAVSALVCMTILSTMMGLVLPSILPKQYTHIIGGILFLYFGIKLIYDSRSMSDKVSDELEEVEEELLQHNKKDDEADIESSPTGGNVNSNSTTKPTSPTSSSAGESDNKKILMQSFLLTFLAEWGDRSQIATIALAAAKNPYGVTIGGCIGHSLCTGLAVIGGRMLASKISEKTVSFWGGSIFLVFAIHSLFFDSAE